MAAEAGGNLGYLLLHREFFYLRPGTARQEIETPASGLSRLVLHPTLGFIRRPGLSMRAFADERLEDLAGPGAAPGWAQLRANEFGFFSRESFPFEPRPGEFTVGIFGGSLAHWLALQGRAILGRELAKLPAASGRAIRVVNFAQGGFKQPQQLFTLVYFLSRGQRFDLVINVDGFNEVALSRINAEQAVEPTLPSVQQLSTIASLMPADTASTAGIEAVAAEVVARNRVRSAEGRLAGTRFAVSWLWSRLELAVARRQLQQAGERLAVERRRTPSLLHLNPLPESMTPEDAVARAVDQWAECSSLMAAVLSARGAGYLHVVQPNQYWGAHPFSEEERRLAVNPLSPYREGVRIGYPQLLDRVLRLRGRGIAVVSAVDLFDGEARAVYADDCCHLNQVGNEILARYVAVAAATALDTPAH